MIQPILRGYSILVVEDDPLIAMDIALTLEQAGARVSRATSVSEAHSLAYSDGLSVAVIDHTLGDGDSSAVYQALRARGIPFVIYSGSAKPDGVDAPHVAKPATPEELVSCILGVLTGSQNSN